MWRKNRGKSSGCTGTDLNRNWGYRWGGAGSSRYPCKEIYAGASAFSEPETAAVSKFVLAHAANMKVRLKRVFIMLKSFFQTHITNSYEKTSTTR